MTMRASNLIRTGLVVLLGSVFLLSGCVSNKKYNQLSEERDNLVSQNTYLSNQVERLGGVNVALGQQLQEKEARSAQMSAEAEALVNSLEAEVQAGQIEVEQMRDGIRVNLSEDVLFRSGASEVSDEGREVLGRVARELAQDPYQIIVGGHTDNVPIGGKLAERYPSNWSLAGARAAEVVAILEQGGVAPERLVSLSFGDTRPIASNDSEEGRKKNRRIGIRLRPVVLEGNPEPAY